MIQPRYPDADSARSRSSVSGRGCAALGLTDAAVHIRPQDIRDAGGNVDVLLLEAEDFANPQRGCGTDGSHEPFPVWQSSQENEELIRCEHIRPPTSCNDMNLEIAALH
jgi:hypothetical protein